MNLLLLGSSGFTGHNMRAYFSAKPEYTIDAPSHSELDVLDEGAVVEALRRGHYDVVLNCLDSTDGDGYMERRLRMFMNLAHHADLYSKMIYFGTGAEYGRQQPLVRVREDDIGRCIPADTYGLAMYIMNDLTRKSRNIYNLRLFGIFGPYERWQTRFISNAICKKLRGYPITLRCDRKMSYLDVQDLCFMVEWIATHESAYHDYNAVPAQPYLLSELAALVNDSTPGAAVPVYTARSGLQDEYTADGSRAACEMGVQCRSMEQSVRELAQWYAAHSDIIDSEKLLYQG